MLKELVYVDISHGSHSNGKQAMWHVYTKPKAV